eukprot:g45749.t1
MLRGILFCSRLPWQGHVVLWSMFAVNGDLFKFWRLFEGKKWRCRDDLDLVYGQGLSIGDDFFNMFRVEAREVLHRESVLFCMTIGSSFVCWFDDNVAIGLESVDGIALCLGDVLRYLVALDIWEHLEIYKEGQMDWLRQQIMESHYIIVICSKGMKFFIEKKHRKHKGSSRDGGQGELFIVAVSMIAERLRQARLNSSNPSKFIAVYFDYSCEADIPGALDLACKYKLMDHFPQLYSHLHARDHGQPDRDPTEVNIRKSNYFRTKSGRSLYIAISNMKQLIEQEPDWFEKQLVPRLPLLPHHQGPVRVDSGLVLNEVVFKQPVTEHDFHLKTIADVTPVNSVSYSVIQHLRIIGDADVSDHQDASSLLRPPPRMVAAVNLPEMPRDSGIYDSSIPSSELSLPLMDGLSSDQTETGSIADSVSSSSGL